MASGFGAAEEDKTVARQRANLEPAQLLWSDFGQPDDDRTGGVRLDELLRRPEPLRRRVGLDPYELPLAQSHVLQARQVRMPGRADDHDLATGLHDLTETGRKEPPLDDGRLSGQNFGDGPARPSATGQLHVQCRPA